MNTKLEQAKRIAEETYDELQETLRFDPRNLIYIKHLQEKVDFWDKRIEAESCATLARSFSTPSSLYKDCSIFESALVMALDALLSPSSKDL